MYGYVRPHRLALVAGGFLSLLTGATGLALPLVVKVLISNLGNHRAVAGILLLMTALVVTNAALGALGSYVLQRTATGWWTACSGSPSAGWTAPSPAT
jgi:ATP-binding cassette subfamily C protein